MRLLIISQFFPPETNAAAHRIGFLAEKLSENKDNDVTVICEPPNYPKGVLFDGYKNSLFSAEKKGNITIIRSWVRITARRDFINRIVTYFSFFFSGLLAGTRVPKPDVVFASAPPLPVLFSGFIISKLRGVSLVSEVRDIWPDSVVAVGMMKKGVLFKILESCEKTVYRGSSAVIVNADGIRRRLIKDKGVSPEKTVVIRNGADLDLFSGAPNPNIIDEQYGTKNKFVVLFSGLIGLAQSPEVVIRAAELLRGEEDVVFMLVGEGVLKKQSEEAKKGIWTGFGSEENQTSWYKEDKRLREIRITLSNITNKIILLARDMSKIELEEQAIEGQLKKEAKKKVGVMLIHGITGLPTAMDEFDLYLRQKGYITYKVRLPGHGRTMEEFFYTPVSEIEDFLISAFKYFYQYMSDINYGDGRFYVIGNSLGSMMPLHIMAINRQGLYPYQSMVKGIVSMSACVIPATAYPLFKYPTATKAVSSVMDFLSKWVGVSKGGSKVDKLINKIKKRDLAPDKFEETVKQEIKPLIKKMLEKRKKSFEQKGLEYAYTDQDIQRIIETIMNNLKQGNIALDKADVINIDAILTTKSMQGSALKTVSAIGKFTMQLKEDVKHIKIPILILQGLHDTVTHPSSADYIYGSVQTPWKFKKVVFLSKSGHNPNIDYDKDRVFEESFGFIERVEKEQEKIESTPIYE